MHRASRTVIALVVGSALGGCYHYTADIPGVLDTRSDGSTADASPPNVSDEGLRREGLAGILSGEGVRADGAHVRVEERHFFAGVTALAPGAFVLSNDSAKEELEAVVGDDALREVRIGHQYSGFDVVLTLLTNLVPCVPLLLLPQPYTFHASGERIASSGQPPANRPVAPPVEVKPPVVEETPAPAPEGTDGAAAGEGTTPDAPKPDAPKPDAPKPDAPKPDAPKSEGTSGAGEKEATP